MRDGSTGLLAGFRRSLTGDAGIGRWLWLGGALALIAGGIGLAVVGKAPEPENRGERVAVALPPVPDKANRGALLLPAPDPDLVEDSSFGLLPVIGRDGRQPWRVYARPFDRTDRRPRIALVVAGLGLDHALSQAALDRLPGSVTLGFDPYAADIKQNMAQARNLGHETLIGLPLEPMEYPREDPGPLTLLTSLDQGQNTARLHKLMGEAVGYVGLIAVLGARFEAESTNFLPILQEVKQRGLMLVDNRAPAQSAAVPLAAQLKLPWAAGNRVIDGEADPAAIDQAFADLEATAQRDGGALGIAAISPALLERVGAWLGSLEGKGFALAPASAIVGRQAAPATPAAAAAAVAPPPAAAPAATPAAPPAGAAGEATEKNP